LDLEPFTKRKRETSIRTSLKERLCYGDDD
jgi:hypothetical protein